MDRIIGIPANGADLSDNISAHFGHSNYFVGVKVLENNNIEKAFTMQNNGHTGCMEPVLKMKSRNVTDIILGGIGGRPFMAFLELGINVYQGIEGSINRNVEFLLRGELKPLGGPSCGGHGGQGGSCNHSH